MLPIAELQYPAHYAYSVQPFWTMVSLVDPGIEYRPTVLCLPARRERQREGNRMNS
jgi:hypothetical protein